MSDILVTGGVVLSLCGLIGLVWCIFFVARAKRSGIEDAALREKLQRALPLNLAALFLSMIGLMLVIIGIFLK